MSAKLALPLLALMLASCSTAARPLADAQTRAQSINEDFESDLCIGGDCRWAIAQQINGSVDRSADPLRPGYALIADAGPKAGGTVAKADLVARIDPAGEGSRVAVAFDLFLPQGSPANSIQLVDLECATCGEGGNPGVRLYLRHGRLRIDRSKIGHEHAWVSDNGPQLVAGQWNRVTFDMAIAADNQGSATATLNGQSAVSGQGATIMPLNRRYVDRVQIGITANSNAVPAQLLFDNIAIRITPPKERR